MTAHEQIAMMLNQLMGPTRNNDVDRSALNYKDDEVCKSFLVAFCPHELFTNTKADLGACKYLHDENLRIAYRNSSDFERLGYERNFYRFLARMHDEMNRRIVKNKERLALTQGKVENVDSPLKSQLTAKIRELESEIVDHLKEAERFGSMGQLDKSQKSVKKAEDLRREVDNAKQALATDQQTLAPHLLDPNVPKPMEVCETCGCFLIIGDAQQRIEEHFSGKQHVGYAKVTSTMNELKARLQQLEEEEDRRRSPPNRSRSRKRERERSRSRDRQAHRNSAVKHHRTKRSRYALSSYEELMEEVQKQYCAKVSKSGAKQSART